MSGTGARMIQMPDREELLSKDMFTCDKKFLVILSILSTLNNDTIKQQGLAESHHAIDKL